MIFSWLHFPDLGIFFWGDLMLNKKNETIRMKSLNVSKRNPYFWGLINQVWISTNDSSSERSVVGLSVYPNH
jgi:hypothetical protein